MAELTGAIKLGVQNSTGEILKNLQGLLESSAVRKIKTPGQTGVGAGGGGAT